MFETGNKPLEDGGLAHSGAFNYLNLPEYTASPANVTAFQRTSDEASTPASQLPVITISLTAPDHGRDADGGGFGGNGWGGGGGGDGDGGGENEGDPEFRFLSKFEFGAGAIAALAGLAGGGLLYLHTHPAAVQKSEAIGLKINALDTQINRLRTQASYQLKHDRIKNADSPRLTLIHQAIQHNQIAVNELQAQMPSDLPANAYEMGGFVISALAFAGLTSLFRYVRHRRQKNR